METVEAELPLVLDVVHLSRQFYGAYLTPQGISEVLLHFLLKGDFPKSIY